MTGEAQGKLGALARLLTFAAVTLPLMPAQQFFIWCVPQLARRFPHHYHRLVCRIIGIRLIIEGKPPKGPCLIAANHVSWLDIVVLSAALPCSFIAKHEVREWPFFGYLARLQRTVFVNRDKRTTTGHARNEIADRLSQSEVLVLFPEGTSGDGKSVKPFKSSLFGAAGQSTQVVPASLSYLSRWGLPLTARERPHVAWYGDMDLAPHLWTMLASGPVEVQVTFHEALPAHDRKHAARRAEQQVRAGLLAALHGPRDLR